MKTKLLDHLVACGNKSGVMAPAPAGLKDLKSAIEGVPFSVDARGMSGVVSLTNMVPNLVEQIKTLGSMSAVGEFRNLMGRLQGELAGQRIEDVAPEALTAALEKVVDLDEMVSAVGESTALLHSLRSYSGNGGSVTGSSATSVIEPGYSTPSAPAADHTHPISDIVGLQSALDGLDSDIATINGELATMDGEITTLSSDLGTLSTDVDGLSSDVIALSSDLDTLESTVTTLQDAADNERVALTPSTGQNNYATGASTSAAVRTIVAISPTASIVLTGISTSGWETGKTVVVKNETSRTGADGRLIIMPRESTSSSAANRFDYPGARTLPLTLMPGESAEFYFNGTNLQYVSSSRPMSKWGLFDACFDAINPYGVWSSGTGASGSYASYGTDSGGRPYSYFGIDTGTTTTGYASLMDGDSSVIAGQGSIMFLGRCRVPVLSTGTDEFDAIFGYARTGTPTDGIHWLYDRNTSTSWVFRTMSNSVATTTTTSLTVAASGAGSVPILGVFVNGNGTRAEAFYSSDDGVTWAVHGTALTTNIPTSTRVFGFGGTIVKSAGTTSRDFYISWAGTVGWL